jgi:hypothetical protein
VLLDERRGWTRSTNRKISVPARKESMDNSVVAL